jgi:hypothetical protein
MEPLPVIEAVTHLATLKSWNQRGSMEFGKHTKTIKVIEGLLDHIEELKRVQNETTEL